MDNQALLEMKRNSLMKAFAHEEGDYVPNLIVASCATVDWAGKKVTDIIHDPQTYVDAMTAVFSEMWADGNFMLASLFSPRLEQVFDPVQYKFGPDGITPEHIQLSPMKADEYDQLIEDPDRYVTEVLLPRKYAKLFEDREYAKQALKVYAEDKVYCLVQLWAMTSQVLQEKYGIIDVINMGEIFDNPVDILFDSLRGFKGTLTDLRRQPDKVKQALERLWETRCAGQMSKPAAGFPYSPQMPHIPAYLSPKQFDELYWPYEKQQIERIANSGGKAFIALEGRWEKFWHHFLELPKDSCILSVDDDDFLKAHAELGHHHILVGGLSSSDVRLKTFDQIKDDIMRVIDTCAPGGGFIFGTNKVWLAPGDVNQTLIDAYNFAHEYSKK